MGECVVNKLISVVWSDPTQRWLIINYATPDECHFLTRCLRANGVHFVLGSFGSFGSHGSHGSPG